MCFDALGVFSWKLTPDEGTGMKIQVLCKYRKHLHFYNCSLVTYRFSHPSENAKYEDIGIRNPYSAVPNRGGG